MAQDATGTPTSLGIPTYNVNQDAPTGNGFNAAMAEIDALIKARVADPSTQNDGEPLVWDAATLSWKPVHVKINDTTKFLRGDGTWAVPAVSNLISHTEITASVTSSATTIATAVTVITAPTFTPDGTSPYLFEVFTPDLSNGNIQANIFLTLHDGSAFVGEIALFGNGGTTVPSSAQMPVLARRRYVPTATAKTYTVRLSATGGTSTFGAGTGGTNLSPAYLRIVKDN